MVLARRIARSLPLLALALLAQRTAVVCAQLVDYSGQNMLTEAQFFPQSYPFPQLFAIDLPTDVFVNKMASSARKWFAVAFYVPWSPHSQRFAPRLERVAMAYNNADTDVFVGRVDCQAEAKLCEHFGVTAFPTFYVGTTEEWIQALGQIDRAQRGVVSSTVFFFSNSTVTVKGHDRETIRGLADAEACADLCVRRLWCLSFEFSSDDGGEAGPTMTSAVEYNMGRTGVCYLQDAMRGDEGVRSVSEWSDLVYFERNTGALTELLGSTDFDEHVEEEHPLALLKAIAEVTGEGVPLPEVGDFRREVQLLDKINDCGDGKSGCVPHAQGPDGDLASDSADTGGFVKAATAEMWYNSTRVSSWDLETAVAESLFYAMEQHHGNPWQEQALEDWTEVLCERYPDYGCRESLCGLRRHLPRYFNFTGMAAAQAMTDEWRLCGRSKGWEAYRSGWQSCRGSWPNTRGFPCGLWLLFHTMASTAKTALEAVQVLRGVRQYVDVFFGCRDCRMHFSQLLDKAPQPQSQAEVVMLLWSVHNQINVIVQEEMADTEAEGWSYGDPAFPHVIFPPRALCPECYSGIHLDPRRVYDFLQRFYGRTEKGIPEEPPTWPWFEHTRKKVKKRKAAPGGQIDPLCIGVNCNGHGTCEGAACICDPGYRGDHCGRVHDNHRGGGESSSSSSRNEETTAKRTKGNTSRGSETAEATLHSKMKKGSRRSWTHQLSAFLLQHPALPLGLLGIGTCGFVVAASLGWQRNRRRRNGGGSASLGSFCPGLGPFHGIEIPVYSYTGVKGEEDEDDIMMEHPVPSSGPQSFQNGGYSVACSPSRPTISAERVSKGDVESVMSSCSTKKKKKKKRKTKKKKGVSIE